MHPCRALFCLEAAVNAVSAPILVLAPELGMGDVFGRPMAEATAEAVRWFGTLTFVFGGLLLGRVLRSGDATTMAMVLQAFFLGDLIFTAAAARWVLLLQRVPLSAAGVFTVAFSLVLLVARIFALLDVRRAMAPKVCD